MTDLPPEKRGVGVVFQNYALFANMTVTQNPGSSHRRKYFDERARPNRRWTIRAETTLSPGRSKRCLVFIRSGFGANVVAICFGAAPDSEGGETREQHNIAGHRPPCAASPCH